MSVSMSAKKTQGGSYIPPHLREDKDQYKKGKDQSKNQGNQANKVKVEVKDEFPALSQAPVQKKSTMDFKELFARRKELKKRQKKMKYGWVRLTKDGMIDSLTPEQREQSNLEINERRMEHAMIDLAYRIERDTERRIEFEDLEPVVLEEYSSEESYVSSEESYVDEDEEGYES